MFVHRSNRAERLLEELADLVARAAGGPIEPEYIVVQGRGMERWLALELARKLGVWANAVFLFPRAMVQKALGAVLGPSGREDERFPPEAMLWSLARLLPELKDRPGFGEIRRYLAEDVQERKLFQLAVRL
ncbi:MAG: exodeoxyribonuclease V subunit gamma, partial [Acidobacteriota bacterium]